MRTAIEILIVVALILVNGVFAMGEMAMVSISRPRMAVMAQRRVRGAALAHSLSEDPQRFLPTVQVGITLVSVLAGSFGGSHLSAPLRQVLEGVPALRAFADEIAVAIVVVLITFATLVLGELVPKRMALIWPERIAAAIAGPLLILSRFGAPFVWLLRRSSDLVLRLFAVEHAPQAVTEEELRHVLAEGTRAGVLNAEERAMIERVLRLADKPVRALMTPRTELSWVDRTGSAAAIVAALQASAHSRVVVCDGDVDNPVGVVQSKTILDDMLSGRELRLEAAIERPIVMPDTVTALGALERLKTDTVGLALVMDEYGSFEGVVTAFDVLKAIVGEAEAGIRLDAREVGRPAGPVELEGLTPIDELKSRLELPALPAEGSYHTAGGLLLALLRRLPREGDQIAFAGWRFEVTEMEGRRVAHLRAHREGAA